MAGTARADFDDTRGKLLALLCSGERTVSELARDLDMSANGARWHLERLEQEGLVGRGAVRGGLGKPALAYRLTDEGSLRLSRAYLPVLSSLLAVLLERSGPAEAESVLREAGRALARQRPAPAGSVTERVRSAAGFLGELGGIVVVHAEENALVIEGRCCPLRALIPEHPLGCKAIESMLELYIGADVREQCEKGSPPGCRLHVRDAQP